MPLIVFYSFIFLLLVNCQLLTLQVRSGGKLSTLRLRSTVNCQLINAVNCQLSTVN
ncbi:MULTISPECIES: hypothetical protein [unclassified Microcoleus]|uniref:hypothetical protein n=1 Tax=unclassified Microcoleus TaxID=2642155 RepID=UPI0025EAB03A|nr:MULTISPECIES: hypothetical protein [unclassified Microcoleus]